MLVRLSQNGIGWKYPEKPKEYYVVSRTNIKYNILITILNHCMLKNAMILLQYIHTE